MLIGLNKVLSSVEVKMVVFVNGFDFVVINIFFVEIFVLVLEVSILFVTLLAIVVVSCEEVSSMVVARPGGESFVVWTVLQEIWKPVKATDPSV